MTCDLGENRPFVIARVITAPAAYAPEKHFNYTTFQKYLAYS